GRGPARISDPRLNEVGPPCQDTTRSHQGPTMHIMLKEYAKGGRHAYELSDDGRDYLGDLDGHIQVGERICAYIETACDSTEEGYDRLLQAPSWLADEIRKRKAAEHASANAQPAHQP